MPTIDELPSTPAHTIQAASEMTGMAAVTLRMWERRYGVVRPKRSKGNYRLYSDRDVGLLRWLKHEVDRGTPIREASAQLRRRVAAGNWPTALPRLRSLHKPSISTQARSRELFDSLIAADEPRARSLLRRAGTEHDLDSLCLRIITPCLVDIGEAWHRGEIRVAQEHYASAFLRGHLLSLYQAYPLRRRSPRVFVGCAPSEQHEIGALMLALFLRRGGGRVEYLGPNLDTADLVAYALEQHPSLVALSATTEGPALALERTLGHLGRLRPKPLIGFGGRVFNLDPSLRRLPGRFLGEDAAQGAGLALQMLKA
ncbi:MAG TPA: MerR family transcriptional regulator [Anaerolineales bacterium]|nr:MerR family transcriptional regulator [Anaerolineales bacterium]